MTQEIKHQSDIVHSVRKDGGYARKISSQFQVGLPDLLVHLPGFAPCVIEVKKIDSIKNEKFSRQFDHPTTDKQLLDLKTFNDSNALRGQSSFIVVAIEHMKFRRLVICKFSETRLTNDYASDLNRWVDRQPGRYYDMKQLLEWAGAIRL